MSKYGQYCPVAKALEILGDRWTLLIIRDMLSGIQHFNDLQRGLPGISRAILATRLRQLEGAGIIEKRSHAGGRKSTEYHLTAAGQALPDVIRSLWTWGEAWAFGDPMPEELDPVLLMWWMRNSVDKELLPDAHHVLQFDFHGVVKISFWLILTPAEASLCLTDPGYPINMLISSDLAVFFKLWAGRISYPEALNDYDLTVDGIPSLTRAFPTWFGWSAVQTVHEAELQPVQY